MSVDPETLWPRWQLLMRTFLMDDNRETFKALIKAYTEPHRAYHTLAHIMACFQHLDQVDGNVDNPHEIELALWFHDAIYEPFSKTNEEDSAKWAIDFLEQNERGAASNSRIYDLIMITKEHRAPENQDAKFMLDIDLSILGTPEHVYDQFEKDVRFEYKRVPGFLFRRKRKSILQTFLNRDQIYQTNHFRDKLETHARLNLKRAIAAL